MSQGAWSLNTYNAHPKWDTGVPHRCQCHHRRRVRSCSKPFAQINTLILLTTQWGRSCFLLCHKGQKTEHKEVHGLDKVRRFAGKFDFRLSALKRSTLLPLLKVQQEHWGGAIHAPHPPPTSLMSCPLPCFATLNKIVPSLPWSTTCYLHGRMTICKASPIVWELKLNWASNMESELRV